MLAQKLNWPELGHFLKFATAELWANREVVINVSRKCAQQMQRQLTLSKHRVVQNLALTESLELGLCFTNKFLELVPTATGVDNFMQHLPTLWEGALFDVPLL